MTLKLKVHHSVSDWDFEQGALYRSLSAGQFVSPPTSLRLWHGVMVWGDNTILCNDPGTLNIPQGEVRTWLWNSISGQNSLFFRSQSPVGSAIRDNCYFINPEDTATHLFRIVAGVTTYIGTVPLAQPHNAWWHLRVKFWNGFNPAMFASLCIEIYREVAGVWVKQGDTLYDTVNQWQHSAINRSGIGSFTTLWHLRYFDDTEIWGP